MFWWRVVPQASRPCASVVVLPFGLQGPPTDAMILITTEVGMAAVRGLLISDFRTDNDCRPFGVTTQEQQEMSSSAGSNV